MPINLDRTFDSAESGLGNIRRKTNSPFYFPGNIWDGMHLGLLLEKLIPRRYFWKFEPFNSISLSDY